MKKFLPVMLLYNSILICLLVGAGLQSKSTNQNILIVLLFIPMWVFFALTLSKKTPFIKHLFTKKLFSNIQYITAFYSAIFINIFFVALLLNIKSTIELFFITILLPLEIYFVISLFHIFMLIKQKSQKETIPLASREIHAEEELKEKDRRAFLKLALGAGAGFLLTSLINPQKAGAAFFGSVPGPGTIGMKDTTGTKIDPAIKSPTDGYGIANTYSTSYPYYYGFVNKDGAWYIVKEIGDGSFLYAKGNTGYTWSNRALESYDTYDAIF